MKPDGSLTDLEMWSYWRDDKGHTYALESQYADLLHEDFILKTCMFQIAMAKKMIDERMQQLAELENKLNGWEDY